VTAPVGIGGVVAQLSVTSDPQVLAVAAFWA
jgi:hypothetical protein